MKTNKIVWLAALTVLLAGANVGAQERKNMERGERPTAAEVAKMRTQRMTEALDLTPEQQKQVEQLNLEQARKMEARQADRQNVKAQMKEILTPEQYAEWERMNAHGHRRGHGPGMKGDSAGHGCKAYRQGCCKSGKDACGKNGDGTSCCKKNSCGRKTK